MVLLSDHGAGIDSPHVERIFERFYRVESIRPDALFRGAGLGLAIVKSIMDLHHGTCGVTSDPGFGTTFWLRFAQGESRRNSGDAEYRHDL